MAHVFNYVVLLAIPDRGRGERVNIGVIVFLRDRVDIRLAELGKLRALTGIGWESYVEDMRVRLLGYFANAGSPQDALKENPRVDPYFEASQAGWFSADDNEDYESSVRRLLNSLVNKPKSDEVKVKSAAINAEIAKALKASQALAKRDEPLENHRVHRDYTIEDKLMADFVQKNGFYRVATTLDLRKARVDLEETALKAITLDRAKTKFGKRGQRICVFAAKFPDEKNVRSSLSLIQKYAQKMFNWEDHDERKSFMNFIFEGMNRPGPLV